MQFPRPDFGLFFDFVILWWTQTKCYQTGFNLIDSCLNSVSPFWKHLGLAETNCWKKLSIVSIRFCVKVDSKFFQHWEFLTLSRYLCITILVRAYCIIIIFYFFFSFSPHFIAQLTTVSRLENYLPVSDSPSLLYLHSSSSSSSSHPPKHIPKFSENEKSFFTNINRVY
jgi:hypothetical protein